MAKLNYIFVVLALFFGTLLLTDASDYASAGSPLRPENGGSLSSQLTPTPFATATQCPLNYTYAISGGAVVTATNLLPGSQCGSCVVPVNLSFPFTFYGQTYTTANVSTRGNLQFITSDTSSNSCPPIYPQLGPAILPNWDSSMDLSQPGICHSLAGRPCGIYTSVSGSAPDRIFDIEWLGRRIGSNTYLINFELRLYESTGVFDFVYGVLRPPGFVGRFSSIGIQDGLGSYINYACHVDDSIYQYLLLRWTPTGCGPTSTTVPTSTATFTPSVSSMSATSTQTSLPTSTSISLPTSTRTATATATIGPPCGIAPNFYAQTTCAAPSTYDYSFQFYVESGCGPSTGTATITFEVAPNANGLWTTYDTQYRSVTFPGGPNTVTISGSLTESGIPAQNTVYRIGFSAPLSNGTHAYGLTVTNDICGTPTPTPCALTFTDVPAEHPFYPYIRCLACRGIVSGYGDGTFRPENSITRGQISKIVSNTAGLIEEPGQQVYEDVPPADNFYTWINRLSRPGFMGGYPCGSVPEEPCNPPGNRPYFRPGNGATRGQLSKIVSNAAGLEGVPTGYLFADVPEEHPFYVWIMRLSERQIIGGYPCGTAPEEPCDNANRPYFRPYAEVTRGQASKIVANTFFPNCQAPGR